SRDQERAGGGVAATAKIASGSPIRSPTWVSDMRAASTRRAGRARTQNERRVGHDRRTASAFPLSATTLRRSNTALSLRLWVVSQAPPSHPRASSLFAFGGALASFGGGSSRFHIGELTLCRCL